MSSATPQHTQDVQLIIDLTETDLPSDTPVYVYIVGLVVDTFYYLDSNSMPCEMQASDNTIPANTFPGMKQLSANAQAALAQNYPSNWADWSIPVAVGKTLTLSLGNINTGNIQGLGTGTSAFSGRIYFSVGIPKLPFTVQATGYTAPVFGNGSGVPGSMTLFDWIEFSYDSNGQFNGNTTQVDQFGFPLLLAGTSADGQPSPTQGELNTSRAKILGDLATGAPPFAGEGVIVNVPPDASEAYPPNTLYLRALSPAKATKVPALATYFDNVINTAYAAWQSTPIVIADPATGPYTGVVFPTSPPTVKTPDHYPDGSLVFYQGSFPTIPELAAASPDPAFFLTGSDPAQQRISSNDIWTCENTLASGGDAQKNVGKILAAAFNRGMIVNSHGEMTTLLDDSDCSKLSGSFYSPNTTFNPWAEMFHAYSANTLAYGFPYDDVCERNPSIQLVPGSVTIKLGKFFS